MARGTEAYLVPDGGTNFLISVQDGANIHPTAVGDPFPRSSCLAAYGRRWTYVELEITRELKADHQHERIHRNQLAFLSQAGYLALPLPRLNVPASRPRQTAIQS